MYFAPTVKTQKKSNSCVKKFVVNWKAQVCVFSRWISLSFTIGNTSTKVHFFAFRVCFSCHSRKKPKNGERTQFNYNGESFCGATLTENHWRLLWSSVSSLHDVLPAKAVLLQETLTTTTKLVWFSRLVLYSRNTELEIWQIRKRWNLKYLSENSDFNFSQERNLTV